MPAKLPPLLPVQYDGIIRRALDEDLGAAGDLTSEALVAPDTRAIAVLAGRKPGRLAGVDVAAAVFRTVDPSVEVEISLEDGSDLEKGSVIARIAGPARAVLTAERTALNLMTHMSGVASATADAVRLIEGTGTRITCTRKTTPGLRVLDKYAVRAGGGVNHRFGLNDGILIKDNHIVAAGGVSEAVKRARSYAGHMVAIEVEVDTLDQLSELLDTGANAVLLDNMSPEMLRDAVAMVAGRMTTEASGGVTPETLRAIAESGVDLISMGWLTHSSPSLDIGLDFQAA